MGGKPLGGVIVCVNNRITTLVKQICKYFQFGILLKLDKSLFSTNRDVIYVNIYIPPERSLVYENSTTSLLQKLEESLSLQDLSS